MKSKFFIIFHKSRPTETECKIEQMNERTNENVVMALINPHRLKQN